MHGCTSGTGSGQQEDVEPEGDFLVATAGWWVHDERAVHNFVADSVFWHGQHVRDRPWTGMYAFAVMLVRDAHSLLTSGRSQVKHATSGNRVAVRDKQATPTRRPVWTSVSGNVPRTTCDHPFG